MVDQRPEKSSGRSSFDEVKRLLVLPPGTEPPASAQEIRFDKAAPTAPPGNIDLKIPPWLAEVYGWIGSIVADEAVVLDICLDRVVQIVQGVHDRGLVGIDHFPEAYPGGMAPTRMNMVAVAAPLAVELYKQVLAAINERKGEFALLVAKAQEKKKAAEGDGTCP